MKRVLLCCVLLFFLGGTLYSNQPLKQGARSSKEKKTPLLSLHENNYFLLFQEPVKFQYSFKIRLFRLGSFRDEIYFAYTQKSLWDFWAWNDSLPFLETNYSPELFYRHYYKRDSGIIEYFQGGIWHQSNGKGGVEVDLNRSWNHLYAELGFRLLPRLLLRARVWLPFGMGDNPNKDIADYVGYGKLTLEAGPFPEFLSSKIQLALHKGWSSDFGKMNLELNMIFGPINLGGGSILPIGLHLQLWHGYCETLLNFNKSNTIFRFGFAILID